MTLQARIALFIAAVGADVKAILAALLTTQRIVYWNKTTRVWGTRGTGLYWTWVSTDDDTATAPASGAGQQIGDTWRRKT